MPPMNLNTKRINISLPEAVLDDLRTSAAAAHMNLSEYVRRAIEIAKPKLITKGLSDGRK